MAQDQGAGTEHYEEIEDYDYNNPNDTANFCPRLQVKGERSYILSLSQRVFPASYPVPIQRKVVGDFWIRWGFVDACPTPGFRELSIAEETAKTLPYLQPYMQEVNGYTPVNQSTCRESLTCAKHLPWAFYYFKGN